MSLHGVAITPNARAQWQPGNRLDFGNLAVGKERSISAVLLSVGTTALIVHDVRLEQRNQAFRFSYPPHGQIESEGLLLFVTFAPGQPGLQNNMLVAETNAGKQGARPSGQGCVTHPGEGRRRIALSLPPTFRNPKCLRTDEHALPSARPATGYRDLDFDGNRVDESETTT